MSDETTPGLEPVDKPEPSLNPNYRLSFMGWPSEEDAHDLAKYIQAYASELSRGLDLSRLEAIVIGMDYEEALSSVDCGGDGTARAVATSNEYGNGKAMALPVDRLDGEWNVLVLWAPMALLLRAQDDPQHDFGLNTFVHELVHVHDQTLFNRTFPGGWTGLLGDDPRRCRLLLMTKTCQSEYVATRRSAWADPQQGFHFLDMLESAMRDVGEQIRSARYAYRRDADLGRLWELVQMRGQFLFQALGYALGHADGILTDTEFDDELKAQFETRLDVLRQLPTGWMVDEARQAVQHFHRLPAYTGGEQFDAMINLGERFLNQFGVFIRSEGENIRIDIPLRAPWLDL
jgi:hypothetical protein